MLPPEMLLLASPADLAMFQSAPSVPRPLASSENRFLVFRHDSDYSAVTPVNLMTSAHFRVSSSMNLAKSAGEPANMSQPRSAKRAFMPASSSAALICLFSLSTIAGGVPLGATMPYQPLAS